MGAKPTKPPAGLQALVLTLIFGAIAPLLDITIVNVAIPKLGHDLNTTVDMSQWIITGYLLAMGVVIPISGWLLERIGGRRLWISSLVLFLVGSILAGFAWNIESKIVFRVMQGAAAGVITPLMTTLIFRAAKGAPLGKIMATASLPVVVIPILGPVVAGVIMSGLDWRWIFFVNIPIVAIGIILAWWRLPKEKLPHTHNSFDRVGFVQIAAAFALILYGLSKSVGIHGFLTPEAYIPLIIGVILLSTFVVYSLYKTHPLINIRLLRSRSYSLSLLIFFMTGLAVYGPLLLISLFYQDVQHKTVLETGLLLAPQGIGSFLPRVFAGKLIDTIGPRPVIFGGLILTALGTLPLAFASANTSAWFISAVLLIRGMGLTPISMAVMISAFKGLSHGEIPDASSTVRIVQQIGGAFGTAILTLILTHELVSHAVSSDAFNISFWWSIGFVIITLIPTFFLPKLVKTAGIQKP